MFGAKERHNEVIYKLDRLLWLAMKINHKEDHELAELDDLKAQVEETKGIEQSAVVLIQGLVAKLDAALAAGDPLALVALKDDLHASAEALAGAVAANQR